MEHEEQVTISKSEYLRLVEIEKAYELKVEEKGINFYIIGTGRHLSILSNDETLVQLAGDYKFYRTETETLISAILDTTIFNLHKLKKAVYTFGVQVSHCLIMENRSIKNLNT